MNAIDKALSQYPYTVADAAKKLGKDEQAVRVSARRKKIGVKFGPWHRFSEADLKKLATNEKRGPKVKKRAKS